MLDNFNMPEDVSTERCNIIRRNHSFDNDMFLAVNKNREFLREYLFWVDKTKTLEDTINATNHFSNEWNEKKSFSYIITDKNNQLLGCIGFHNVDLANHRTDIGYWLSQDQNGKGYMSEALKALEEIIFDQGMVRLCIKCDVANTPSNNVARKNGYSFEGVHKKAINNYGEFHDENIYAKISPKIT